MKSLYRNKKRPLITALSVCFSIWLFSACERFVTIDPPNDQLVRVAVFEDDEVALAALRGIYNRMSNGSGFTDGGIYSVTALCGLSADEYLMHAEDIDRAGFYANNLDPANSALKAYLWDTPYRYIYYANAILEGAAASERLSQPVRDLLEGEARFIRAFCYFYLGSLFGEVPLVLETDYRVNAQLAKSPQPAIFEQVVSDLQRAYELLPSDYTNSAGERVRPIRWTAAALLARLHLQLAQWDTAAQYATAVLDNTELYGLEDSLDSVFLKNSKEAVWQLMPVVPTRNTAEAQLFVLTAPPNYISLNPELLDRFEPDDLRKSHWIGSFSTTENTYYFPFKYKITVGSPLEEYASVFRLAELYLIRAEALAQLDDLEGARKDLNRIRRRAGVLPTETADKEALLELIASERRLELFSEWGHRWLDLKRTGEVDGAARFYPIPHSETQNNPNLIQNPDYLQN